jgi:ATP-binding cassette subfamily B (MDR/TAP) protein 1
MDVKSAFLNRELIDNVYMVQPNNYEVDGKENLVCKLKKATYGLK